MRFWLYFGYVVIYLIGMGIFITFWKKFKCTHSEIYGSFHTTPSFTGPACICLYEV